jgi:hypothetical protein
MKIQTWITSVCLAAALAVFAGNSTAVAKPKGDNSTPTVKAPKGKETHRAAKTKIAKKTTHHSQHRAKDKQSKNS